MTLVLSTNHIGYNVEEFHPSSGWTAIKFFLDKADAETWLLREQLYEPSLQLRVYEALEIKEQA